MASHILQPPSPPALHPARWVGVGVIVVSVALVAIAGGLATATSVKSWYVTLPKPEWTPPGWVFGPVWTLLYVMMAVAASMVWVTRSRRGECCPMTAFGVQLGLNLAWSVLFFGLRSPVLGFIDVCLLWGAIAVTATQFFRVSRTAGWLMVPYWLWVTFAATLNASIVLHGG